MKENQKEIFIEGMMCEHCKMRVEQALRNMEGVTDVEVSLADKKAIVTLSTEVSNETIIKTIEEAGYRAVI